MTPLFLIIAALFILVSALAPLPQALSLVATGQTAGIEEVGGLALRIVRDLLFGGLAIVSFGVAFRRGASIYWRAGFAVLLVLLFLIYSTRAYLELAYPIGAIIGNARVFMAIMVALGTGIIISSMRGLAPAKWLLLVVFAAASIQILLGAWQIIWGTGAEWAQTWIGYKPIGSFTSYNVFATFCTVSAIFISECLKRLPLRRISRVVLVITVIGLVIMVLASGSRTSIAALLLYLFLEVSLPTRNRLGYAVTIGPPLLILILLTVSNQTFTGRQVDIERDGRLVVWTELFEHIGDSPALIIGAATGGYTSAADSISHDDNGPVMVNPHSVVILLLANYGPLVFFILAATYLIVYFPVMLSSPGTFAAITLLFLPYSLLEMSPVNVIAFLCLEITRLKVITRGSLARRPP